MLVSQNTGLSYHVRCKDLVVWVISAFISTQHARKTLNLKAPFEHLLFGYMTSTCLNISILPIVPYSTGFSFLIVH